MMDVYWNKKVSFVPSFAPVDPFPIYFQGRNPDSIIFSGRNGNCRSRKQIAIDFRAGSRTTF